MAELFLALGSNLGDRKRNIQLALSMLDDAFAGRRKALSKIIDTKACGFDGPDFLNCVVVYETRRRPASILGICKGIELRMGRSDAPEYDGEGKRIYHDRIIDIDILLYGKVRMCTPDLTIPHPQVNGRPYVRELLESLSCQETLHRL